jgi:lipopolysaccharide transport system permease protein
LLDARSPSSPWWHSSLSLLRSVSRNRRLTFELAKRELLDRYAGQLFGSAWAVFHPALTILVFLFLFGEVLKVKLGGANLPVSNDFTTYLLSGLLPWLVIQEVMTRGSSLIVSNAPLVKQVAFPLDVLPIKTIPSAFVILMVGLGLLMIYTLLFVGPLHWTYLLLPYLIVLLALLCIGMALLLASLGVFLRDLKDVVQVFAFVGIYVSPIFYTLDTVPGKLRILVLMNPFASTIFTFQDTLFYGAIIHPWAWPISALLSLMIFVVGARVFSSTQHYFGSYL